MRRPVLGLAATALLLASSLVACAGDPAPQPVVPIDSCIDEDEQRDSGVSLTVPGTSTTVEGLIYGSGTTAIIFANQVNWTLCGWQPYPKYFATKGYLTATFNYSNIAPYDDDVLAFVEEVRRRGATAVILLGASKGGTAVLSAGAKATPPVDGVISLSGPSFYQRVSAQAVMEGYPVPVLFMAARDDRPFADDAQRLYDACTQADKDIIIQVGSSHGRDLLDEEGMAAVEEFLADHVHS